MTKISSKIKLTFSLILLFKKKNFHFVSWFSLCKQFTSTLDLFPSFLFCTDFSCLFFFIFSFIFDFIYINERMQVSTGYCYMNALLSNGFLSLYVSQSPQSEWNAVVNMHTLIKQCVRYIRSVELFSFSFSCSIHRLSIYIYIYMA